jgi:hypothetical protein
LLLSLKKGTGIIFIDVEGCLLEGLFSKKPKPGSQKIIKKNSSVKDSTFDRTGTKNK